MALFMPPGTAGRSEGGIVRARAGSPSSVVVRSKPAGVYELRRVAVSESTRKEWTVPRGIRTKDSDPAFNSLPSAR